MTMSLRSHYAGHRFPAEIISHAVWLYLYASGVGRGLCLLTAGARDVGIGRMELDDHKIDDAVLALLRLTLHDERRAWKGFDWRVLERLHRKGLIANPVGRTKSVVLTDEGLQRSGELLAALFGKTSQR